MGNGATLCILSRKKIDDLKVKIKTMKHIQHNDNGLQDWKAEHLAITKAICNKTAHTLRVIGKCKNQIQRTICNLKKEKRKRNNELPLFKTTPLLTSQYFSLQRVVFLLWQQ